MRTTKGLSEVQRKELLADFIFRNDANLDFPTTALEKLGETDFFRAPASTKWHAAYPGGLFDHSMNVARQLISFTKYGICNPWLCKSSPLIVGILHDLTKVGLYKPEQDANCVTGDVYTVFTVDDTYKELSSIHGEDSMLKADKLLSELGLGLTAEEKKCIRYHVGAYQGKEDWPGYDAAIRAYPNVLWTHTADMFASKLMEE